MEASRKVTDGLGKPSATRRRAGSGFDRKARKKGTIIATNALACKLAKAGWHVVAKDCEYEAERMFPELKK